MSEDGSPRQTIEIVLIIIPNFVGFWVQFVKIRVFQLFALHLRLNYIFRKQKSSIFKFKIVRDSFKSNDFRILLHFFSEINLNLTIFYEFFLHFLVLYKKIDIFYLVHQLIFQ